MNLLLLCIFFRFKSTDSKKAPLPVLDQQRCFFTIIAYLSTELRLFSLTSYLTGFVFFVKELFNTLHLLTVTLSEALKYLPSVV